MKPAAFRYHAPRSLPEALAVLERHPEARPLAGGQSLMPQLNARQVTAPHLLDLNRLDGLDGIEEAEGCIRIGAMARQAALLRSPLLRRHLPILVEAAALVGHIATRNRGTLGGSLCQLDPWAELPLVAALLDAELELAAPSGTRRLAFRHFAQGAGRNALWPGELLTQARFPIPAPGARQAFVEIADRPNDPAEAAAAVSLRLGAGGEVVSAALAVCGPFPVARRLPEGETMLLGWRPGPDPRPLVSAMPLPDVADDDRAAMVRVALRRALERAMA
ncbi:xanthine dehydrogenase family protein subunit M [Roseomonas sp. KE2513]|uniref:FAD binding domain-containing protein n=1 Tax=Roseomonas sp. KE2513 TaxID=2479202 RepID=UPI0018DEFA54|nr:FAD binding domain-containing protein [Roseomonas sp. KE2513]MBI0538661.1 xanthine dehydrogenase family protein subunit M [Roseomonas sp. KE2513]